MKIITTTIEDFVKAEIDEWGFDYVDEKFAQGYEPIFVNGVWCWAKPNHFNGALGSCTLNLPNQTPPLKSASTFIGLKSL